MLHLVYRLVVQPNNSRAHLFAEAFIANGGIETLLVLLQREAKAGDESILLHQEAKAGDESVLENSAESNVGMSDQESEPKDGDAISERTGNEEVGSPEVKEPVPDEKHSDPAAFDNFSSPSAVLTGSKIERKMSVSENPFMKNLGGITFSISADNARNNVYNFDKSDGIVVAVIGLVGALVAMGLLRFGSPAPAAPDMTSNLLGAGLNEGGGTMFDDKVSLLFFALQKAIQTVPNRLMSNNVYTALLGASVCHDSFLHITKFVIYGKLWLLLIYFVLAVCLLI